MTCEVWNLHPVPKRTPTWANLKPKTSLNSEAAKAHLKRQCPIL